MIGGSLRMAKARLATACAMACLWGAALHAQQLPGVGDYRLPGATPTPTPTAPVAGPVDQGVPPPRPATQAARPTPSPSASPTTATVPAIVIPRTVPAARPANPPSRVSTSGSPVPSASASAPAPVATGSDAASPAAAIPESGPAFLPSATTPADSVPPAPAAPSPASSEPRDWTLPAILAALAIVAGAAALWFRRHQSGAPVVAAPDFVRPVVPQGAPPPDVVEEPAAEAPVPPSVSSGTSVPAPEFGPMITLALDATRLSATLVNATLAYRLTLTNGGTTAVESVTVGGDMISAHASLPVEQQLGLSGEVLPALHRIARIEPGESIVIGGEIRLPLAAILPIRNGNAAMFVPIARIEAQGQADGQAIAARTAWLVGQQGEQTAARLAPFRLDLGPRVYAQIGQRQIRMAT